MFLPLAGPNAEHLEHDVSINRAGVVDAIFNCCHVHIGRQRPHLVQHTAEELVGVLHRNTHIKCLSTDYVRSVIFTFCVVFTMLTNFLIIVLKFCVEPSNSVLKISQDGFLLIPVVGEMGVSNFHKFSGGMRQ